MQLDGFRNKLRMFDKALEQIYNEKPSYHDFDVLKQSIDKNNN